MDFEFIRGDTFVFKFKLYDNNGNELKLSGNDELYFTVKTGYNKTDFVMQKRFSTGGIKYIDGYYYIKIEHKDTANLRFTEYVYDIQIMSQNIVKTLVLGNITLTEEVTHISNE